MLKEVEWSKNRDYRSGGEHEPVEFYLDALNESTVFDLQLGYFSSAAISVLSVGFARFLSRGGRMRVIVNDVLSSADKEVLMKVEDGYIYQIPFDLTDFAELKARLDDYDVHFFQCLGWLLQNDRLDIRIIRPRGTQGISHYKCGVFSDGSERVGFSGSCNFTPFGLLQNLERLDVFLSWENGRSNTWIRSQTEDFNEIFERRAKHVEYLNAEQIKAAIATNFGNTDIDELLVQEQKLMEAKQQAFIGNKRLKRALEKAKKKVRTALEEPRFPYSQGPRPYQIEAYDNWVSNNRKGVFAMATGTGKTLTSLNCLLTDYQVSKKYRAVILVPTIALVEQWQKECTAFNFRNIITVSSKENWSAKFSFFNTAADVADASFIVVATYASFVKQKFQSHFALLPADTLLIADEVHNMGAPGVSKLMPHIRLQRRIGLSATPGRKYDEEGNAAIEAFFDDRAPFVYSYSMKKALESGWLCKYTYFPRVVFLTSEELEGYLALSRQLLKYLDPKTKTYRKCKEVDFLLLARKRIIHKAENKKGAFQHIVHEEFKKRGNLKYTLVYVPEGTDPNYAETDTDEETDLEDAILIDEYTRTVSGTDSSIMVKQYTAKTPNRGEVIRAFEHGGVHVLTSMKCLDEGVDVPRSELAIFCASTGNPRQFIQRRGRVLRRHPDKTHAVIHDLVVVPMISDNDSTYEMERSLVRKEIERVVDFSALSLNPMDTYEALKEVLEYYNLNLSDFMPEDEEQTLQHGS